jgi:hypothetical protein
MENMNCNHLINYFNRALTEVEMKQFESHLNHCTECREELLELTDLTGDLPYLSEPITPPIGMKKRILDNVLEEESPSEEIELVTKQTVPTIIQKRSWWTPLLAATLLLSLIGNGYALFNINEEKSRSTNLAMMVNSVELQPSETFTSSGEASIFTYENEVNIVVQADQLNAIKENEVYQVWLIKDGKPIPAGSFVPDTKGDGSTYYKIKSDEMEKWDTIAITLEPKHGNQLPEGSIVLSSSL